MLQNRLYRGEIAHQDRVYPGQHEAIIEPELWQAVQDRLMVNRRERSLASGTAAPSLLSGLIVDGDGNRLSPTHAVTRGKRYRYYVSAALITGGRSQHIKGWRIPAGDIEGLVRDHLRSLFASPADISDAVAPLDLDAGTLDVALHQAHRLSQRWLAMAPAEVNKLDRDVVERVTVASNSIEICLNRVKVATTLGVASTSQPPDLGPVVVSIEATLRRAGKGKRLVIENGTAVHVSAGLAALIARAVAMRDRLVSGAEDSIEAMTERLGMGKGQLTALVRLSYLAPHIVRALIKGSQPIGLTPTRLLRLSNDLPHDWRDQRQFLGFTEAESMPCGRNAP